MATRGKWHAVRRWVVAAVVLAAVVGVMTTGAQDGNEAVPPDLDNEAEVLIEEALPDKDEADLEAQGRVINIPVAAFTSDGFDPDGYFKSFAGGYFYGKVTRNACLTAPVIFPRGASTIVSVKVFARDTSAAESEWFDLYRITLGKCATRRLGRATTRTNSVCTAYSIPLASRVIANGYAYQITTCARPGIYVYGAQVTYR
jgi:hypothetical protein